MKQTRFLEELLKLLPLELHDAAREAVAASPSTAITGTAGTAVTNAATNIADRGKQPASEAATPSDLATQATLATLTKSLAPKLASQPAPQPAPQQPVAGFHNPISAQDMLLPAGQRTRYLTLGRDFFRELAPAGIRETQLVQQIVDLTWRVNRLGSIENSLMVSGMVDSARECTGKDARANAVLAQAHAWQKDCKKTRAFNHLGLYEAGLRRDIRELGKQFEQLSTLRKQSSRSSPGSVPAPSAALAWYQNSLAS